MNPILLGVNVDHIATLRQVRRTIYPKLSEAAALAISGGADSITIHLREDRRHINDDDVMELKNILTVPMNLELALTDEMLDIAESTKPEFCCFVPEKRQELTTEGGLDVFANKERVKQASSRMQTAGIKTSLFIDADYKQIQAAAECGVQIIEIHTGCYANAINMQTQREELIKITNSVKQAIALGMQVNAGHGLNYGNVFSIACIQDIHELNIGHAIVARALFIGLDSAVVEMRKVIDRARI